MRPQEVEPEEEGASPTIEAASEVDTSLAAETEGFGPRPSSITRQQYEAIQDLHINMAHPGNTTLCRLLRR